MTSDDRWDRLIAYLDEWASTRTTPHGIEVTFEQPTGGPRTVEIVVDPDGWSEYCGVIWGTDDAVGTDIKRLVMEVPADKMFLVYDREQWEASETRDFPPDPDDDFQPEPGGEWVSLEHEGNVVSRYADWIDRQ